MVNMRLSKIKRSEGRRVGMQEGRKECVVLEEEKR